MLQCIGFASWRDREREGGSERGRRKERKKRRDRGITGVPQSSDKIDLCKCMGV